MMTDLGGSGSERLLTGYNVRRVERFRDRVEPGLEARVDGGQHSPALRVRQVHQLTLTV